MSITTSNSQLPLRKWAELALVWLAALGLSALLGWAGQRWPERLPIQPWLVMALVLGPPALIALVLVLRWPARALGALPNGGLEGGGGESSDCEGEQG
ncbi:hypothetical protein [Cyanobium sp. ATX 6F1]|uniref:hypothetical protein n=1 Tax=Cyanobium sp. ATX 6F1 TaxID=2823702 RepID=UPI0020CE9880|nr:hypothetical protein [Cyanobium sp. ATX 6F1]MCP9917104.1 hypothetical protein [Cyanobium sp. ATX 6F1]